MLAFSEGAVKEASLSFKKGWHSLKELSKVFAILEMCWHSLKELLKKSVGKLRYVLAFTEGAVKKCWQA